jgi:hypothetical protein
MEHHDQWERERDRETCEWFALCTNPATGTLTHPTIGEVPICDRCRERAA